ncbi:lactate permease [Kineosphaera limosa]|uniref:L-lactate permease n=1 Tax=Kineosphaera limosa NBRC 100340 TaxID=1184609 RepID=K6W4Y0_9MICO|nr:L-lactate permease [Kineosphaera limosa]NYE02788.1 lactate permease [Kineosphaera limosa]GAB94220.1 putative L-lactate permease [Kineosphaera limosa NBRC 100340]
MIAAYQPDLAPLGGSLALSALVACLPLLTIFITLGGLRWKAHIAGLTALGVALLVAILIYRMPPLLAFGSAVQGGVFGLFPIMWIVFNAIVLYEITVHSGRFEDLRKVFDLISDDPRVQAIVIAFCFGGLMEALAGFGAPVAITGVMLMAVGFSALRAATVVLLANTAPVAFGAIGTPILTAGRLTHIDPATIGAYVGHQTPIIAFFVPMFIAFLTDGKRGLRQTWPLAVVAGAVFGVTQWISATYISMELTDIISSLCGLAAIVVMLRFWQPQGRDEARASLFEAHQREIAELGASDPNDPTGTMAGAGHSGGAGAATATQTRQDTSPLTGGRIFMALFPYLLVIAFFTVAKLVPAANAALTATDLKIPWPGLDGQVLTAAGTPNSSTVYTFTWLSSPGTILLICGLIVAFAYRVSLADWAKVVAFNAHKMRFAILTVATVLSLAYVMNLSGQTITIGHWIAGTGAAFAFLSPVLGWLGTAVTGSDTSANALFATLQQTAAQEIGIDPTLLVAANTSGGVVGKMISPQNLTIAATAVGLLGREADIFRKVIWWSLSLLVVMCLIVGLQSTPVLSWMLP